jgi:acyl-CoA synthetase (AMP-forming)/AMP-acid ligase II
MGERVCAVVVTRPGARVELSDLRAFAAERLAPYKCPEALHLTDELPKTATGKVAKNVVRAEVAGATAVERDW